jgi:hypothetical protein
MDQNPFLKQFLNMRKNLHKEEVNGTKGKQPKPMADPSGITMAHIIENKPSDKEVIEYFKARCEALSQD